MLFVILCYCSKASGDNIVVLLFVAAFSVVASVLGNLLVIRFIKLRKIKNSIVATCDRLLTLQVSYCKFYALFRYHELLYNKGVSNNENKELIETYKNEFENFRNKQMITEDDFESKISKLKTLSFELSGYFEHENLAHKIASILNKQHKKDKETFSFLDNLAQKCTQDDSALISLHTDIAKFVINSGNGIPFKEILSLLNFNIVSAQKESTEEKI